MEIARFVTLNAAKGETFVQTRGDQRSFPETSGHETKYDHTIPSPCGVA